MNNKNITIVLIVFLSLLALCTIGFMVWLLSGKGNFDFFTIDNNSKLLLDEKYDSKITSINVESISGEVLIKEAEDEQIRVQIYGGAKEIAKSDIENGVLNVSKKGNHFCFFCFYKEEFIIYVPKESQITLDVKTTSGDVEIASFPNIDVNLITTSGNIKIGIVNTTNILSTSGDIHLEKASNIKINTTSGDIDIKNALKSVELQSVSGDIEISEMTLNEDSSIKTTSGEVTINKLEGAYAETNTTSGDVTIKNNNRFANVSLKIKTISGDIDIK